MLTEKTESNTSYILHSLQMIRSEGVGPMTYTRLVKHFGGVDAALKAMPHMKKPIQPVDLKLVEKEHARLTKLGGQWLSKDQTLYPDLLSHLDDAPPVISVLGQTELLSRPMLAIVGSRNASINGRKLAAELARDLGTAGYVIVSGLARGIDTVVHEASLDTGTIAVLANGVDVIYPPENRKLYEAIREKGLLLSENPVGCEPAASLFPRRNRIISGLCQAVIVIEAAAKSGSLITAQCALDQGREVFAIPGSPLDPRASGPNRLIKTGQAQLIESARDVLEALGGLRRLDNFSPEMNFALTQVETHLPDSAEDDTADSSAYMTHDQAKQSLLNCLSPTPCDIDQLVYSTGLPTQQILIFLMEFELMGMIQRLPGNQVARL